jgi:hypothetical protein
MPALLIAATQQQVVYTHRLHAMTRMLALRIPVIKAVSSLRLSATTTTLALWILAMKQQVVLTIR